MLLESVSEAISHVRYINIRAWLRGFRVKIANFSSFLCPSIPNWDLGRLPFVRTDRSVRTVRKWNASVLRTERTGSGPAGPAPGVGPASSLAPNLRSYPPSLYFDAGKEGMIHLLVGSYVQKPDSGFFSDWSRNNTCGLWFAVFWLAVIFQQDFRPEAVRKPNGSDEASFCED